MKIKAKRNFVVEHYSMETLYPSGVYHSPCHFDNVEAVIKIVRKTRIPNLIDIQLIDKETCMVVR